MAETQWPREIWAAQADPDDADGRHVFSVHATVPRWEGDRDCEFHCYVDSDILDSAERYCLEMLTALRARAETAEAERDRLRAEPERLRDVETEYRIITETTPDTLTRSFGRFHAEVAPAEARLIICDDGKDMIRLFGRDLIRSSLLGGSWAPDIERALRWGLELIEAELGEDLRYRAGVMAAVKLCWRLRLTNDPRRAERLLLGDPQAGQPPGEPRICPACGARVTEGQGCGGICYADDALPRPAEDPADKAFRDAIAELVDCAMKGGKADGHHA
ncbi:hypothetical protein [Rhodovulum sp. YEN HP10]|uniref:hypothetical protein n=1 Tax=Rhodovulum sp. HP10 TaxID=3387397 RepID=UPI0039DF7DE5